MTRRYWGTPEDDERVRQALTTFQPGPMRADDYVFSAGEETAKSYVVDYSLSRNTVTAVQVPPRGSLESKILEVVQSAAMHNRPLREIRIHPKDWEIVREDIEVKRHTRDDGRSIPPGAAALFMGVPVVLDPSQPRRVRG